MLLGFRCIMRRGDGASCRLLCRFSFHTARHRSTRPSSPTISSPPPHSGPTLRGEARTLAGDRCFRCDQERNALVLGFDVGSKTRHIWICRPIDMDMQNDLCVIMGDGPEVRPQLTRSDCCAPLNTLKQYLQNFGRRQRRLHGTEQNLFCVNFVV